jgi:hypothetical protein
MRSDSPLALTAEIGARLTPQYTVYGDAWVQPTTRRAGADLGLRYGERTDLFAGGWADLDGRYQLRAGVKHRF